MSYDTDVHVLIPTLRHQREVSGLAASQHLDIHEGYEGGGESEGVGARGGRLGAAGGKGGRGVRDGV